MMKHLQLELQELIDAPGKDGKVWVDRTCPYTDYCKEICEPRTNANYPEGCVGVRVDDDFWPVLVIPLKFRELTVQEIVAVVFPDAKDPTFEPDSGSPEADAKYRAEMDELYKKCIAEEMKRGRTEEQAKQSCSLYDLNRIEGEAEEQEKRDEQTSTQTL